MHILQPKHFKLKPEEAAKLLERYNISLSQLPCIKIGDSALPENCQIGDIIKIERKSKRTGTALDYYRVVIAK